MQTEIFTRCEQSRHNYREKIKGEFMKKIRLFLLFAYCIPFAFLAVNGDANGTLLFYGIMLASFTLLTFFTLKTNNANLLLTGHILSFASSYLTAKLSNLELMAHYFKPFTSHSLIIAISLVSIVLNTIIMLIYILKKKYRK